MIRFKNFVFEIYWLSYFQEKLALLARQKVPVPKTDTGRLVENTKGRETTLSKELGKMTP